MKPRAPVAAAVVVLTARNCEAAIGFVWAEVAALAEERGIPIGRIGRRPYVLLADLLEALDGVRAAPWSDEDTAAEIEAELAPPRRGSAGAR